MQVDLVWVTPEVEKIIGYCARVSNPDNQNNPDVSKLLKYCIDHKHWSIFEMGNMCVEVTTSRAIAQQILRHRSFSFQEFSQRYAKVTKREIINPRRQDLKNRQNSIDDLDDEVKKWFLEQQKRVWDLSSLLYEESLRQGIAKEVARFVLPLSTQTKLYMNGSIRSWITYLQLRTGIETQLEHREVAEQIKNIFIKELPIISKSLGWINE